MTPKLSNIFTPVLSVGIAGWLICSALPYALLCLESILCLVVLFHRQQSTFATTK